MQHRISPTAKTPCVGSVSSAARGLRSYHVVVPVSVSLTESLPRPERKVVLAIVLLYLDIKGSPILFCGPHDGQCTGIHDHRRRIGHCSAARRDKQVAAVGHAFPGRADDIEDWCGDIGI